MPPRYAYWTILIDSKPTAFRAREREELLPTLAQLRRTNSDVMMKWFARSRLWDSPEAEREAQQRPPAAREKRSGDWRPGGLHKDPRDRFKKKNRGDPLPAGSSRAPQGSEGGWRDKPRGDRPWTSKPPSEPPRGDRPWANPNRSPAGPPRGDRPWADARKPSGGARRGDGPWNSKPARPPAAPRGDRPWTNSNRPPSGAPRGERPWTAKPPSDARRGNRPWDDKPRERPQGAPREPSAKLQGPPKPWRDKPAGSPPRDRPWQSKPRDSGPFTPRDQKGPRRRKDDEPDQK